METIKLNFNLSNEIADKIYKSGDIYLHTSNAINGFMRTCVFNQISWPLMSNLRNTLKL